MLGMSEASFCKARVSVLGALGLTQPLAPGRDGDSPSVQEISLIPEANVADCGNVGLATFSL